MAPPRTLPFDIVLALRLLSPPGTLASLAEELAVVPSQVHTSLARLKRAGLLRPDSRETNARALSEFLLYGVRYAFPARRGSLATGVPTAHSAPRLSPLIDAVDAVVWPAPRAKAAVQGFAVAPLYPGAIELRERSPETYLLVTLVDALRLGDRQLRGAARQLLSDALGNPATVG